MIAEIPQQDKQCIYIDLYFKYLKTHAVRESALHTSKLVLQVDLFDWGRLTLTFSIEQLGPPLKD